MASLEEGAIGPVDGTGGSAGELVIEEGAGELPVTFDGARGHSFDFGDLFLGQPGEVTVLHDSRGARIDLRQVFERAVEIDQEGTSVVGNDEVLVERHGDASALGGVA